MIDLPDDSNFKWINLIWNEYKFRHTLYWISIFLWGGAAMTILLTPFLEPEILKELGVASFIFPIAGLALSLIGGWHIAAQRERLVAVGKKLDELRDPQYSPEKINLTRSRTWLQETVSLSISKAFVYLFIFGLGSFALIDAMFEAIYLNPTQWLTLLLISLVLISLAATAMVFTVNKRRKLHNHKLESAKSNMA